MKTTFSKTLEIPKVWKKLLALDFEMSKGVGHARGDTKVADSKPYRDDERIVSMAEAGYVVSLFLCSGNSNYWLDYAIWRGKKLIYEGEAFYDLPKKKDSVTLDSGEVIEFNVKLV